MTQNTLSDEIKRIGKEFDAKWWYDTDNLRLCSKDVPVYDEDDNLIGYNQHGAAVPVFIKEFIEKQVRLIAEKTVEAVRVEPKRAVIGSEEDGYNSAYIDQRDKASHWLGKE